MIDEAPARETPRARTCADCGERAVVPPGEELGGICLMCGADNTCSSCGELRLGHRCEF
jgi:ribosomal protein L32